MNNMQKVENIVDIRTSLSQFIHKHTLNKGSMTSISCRAGLSTVRLITPLLEGECCPQSYSREC